jgi:hypothetical protein
MYSKPGKASENMHLSLASLAKLKKRESGHRFVFSGKSQVQAQHAEVSILELTFLQVCPRN